MPRSNSTDRLKRLELIRVQLKQDELCTVKGLAQQNGVSERTITRDLSLMREQGMPIDADRGRGGGVRLDRNWGVGRINLTYPEAVDLLISIAVAEQMNSSMFLASLGTVRRQLVASFSSDKRDKVNRLKSRILIGVTASTFVQANVVTPPRRAVQNLHQAFVDQRTLAIKYRVEGGAASERLIDPHYLLLNYPVWYVIAFDHLRESPRTFRCDRILEAEQTEARFGLMAKEEFQQSLDGNPLLI